MTFLWPAFLYLLALIPVLIAFYLWILRRRGVLPCATRACPGPRGAASALLAAPTFALWLFLIALASLMVAVARPVSVVIVPTGQTTIILAIDVSRSMCSTDIHPESPPGC